MKRNQGFSLLESWRPPADAEPCLRLRRYRGAILRRAAVRRPYTFMPGSSTILIATN